MSWFLVTILAYFLFAVVFLIDKHLLVGSIPHPKIYTFYTGTLRVLVVLLIPFIDFNLPDISQIILSFFAGGFFIFGLFWFFKALQLFEPSRVVPAIGGILPIFTLSLVFIFSLGKEIPGSRDFLALITLIVGSILISYEKTKKISFESLRISIPAAFFLSLSFVFAKYVYLAQPFLQGFFWISLGGFFTALFFLLLKEVRNNLFKIKIPKKTMTIFISNQAMGAGANILQNWAIALAPLVYVAIVNALQGMQYVFLLVLTVILSLKFPQILKEEISKKILFQKIIAILLIGSGLTLLAFK